MPPQIQNVSAADQQDIRDAIQDAINHLTTQITDAELQSCIREKLHDDATVIIGGGDKCDATTLGYTDWTRFGPFVSKSREIHLCLTNIRRGGHRLGARIMHELAHVCCWPDGGGKGVPENGEDWRIG